MGSLTVLKTCSRCGDTKPQTEFKRDASRKSGFGSRCRLCHSASVMASRAANPEQLERQRNANRAYGRRSQVAAAANARRRARAMACTEHPMCTVPVPLFALMVMADECGYCGGEFEPGDELELDHIIPVASGGRDCIKNLRPAHKFCNRSAGSRLRWERARAAA